MKNRYDELRRTSWNLPEGKQKLAVLEEMIRIADRYMTVEDAYDARMNYMSAASEAGAQEKMLVAFAWCISKFEQSPGDYSHHNLLWHYKWVLNAVWRMPEFSLDLIGRMFEDFKDKCVQYGFNLRPYYQQRVSFALSQGLMEEAASFYKLWRETPRDGLADCLACEQNLFGEYLFRINRLKKGIRAVKPILDGKMRCRSVPQNTFSRIIVPLLKLKEYERAVGIANKAGRELNGPSYLQEYGIFLEFFTVTDMPKAVKLYNRTIRFGLESKIGWDRFHYFLSVRLFLREWSKKRRRRKLAESDLVTVEWLDKEIAALAGTFNRRNGNDFMNRFMEEKERNTRRLMEAFAAP